MSLSVPEPCDSWTLSRFFRTPGRSSQRPVPCICVLFRSCETVPVSGPVPGALMFGIQRLLLEDDFNSLVHSTSWSDNLQGTDSFLFF